jgi:hypothetical protein
VCIEGEDAYVQTASRLMFVDLLERWRRETIDAPPTARR